MKNAIKPLAKNILTPLGLTATASAADVGIHKNILGSGHRHSSSFVLFRPSSGPKTTLINLSILKSLEDFGLL